MAGKWFKFATIRTELPNTYELMKKLGVDEDGAVQNRATDLIMANLPDYMPKASGRLIGGMWKRKPTRVHIDGPYARVQFFGVTKDGKPFDYSKQKNPQGGSHWDRRMVADRGAAITAELQRFAKGR